MTGQCGNCGADLKVGIVSINVALSSNAVAIINMTRSDPIGEACNKCGDQLYKEARATLIQKLANERRDLEQFLINVKIVSAQSPHGWRFDSLGLVTAQTVTGTGIFSEVATAFTDLFGAQSNTYIAKLREAEAMCQQQLRAQTLEMGGDAILAVDIDYAEVGGQRAMLMVCMTGTAVRLKPSQITTEADVGATERAIEGAKRIREIETALKLIN